MPETGQVDRPTQLIVFADDWGRHPSSAQHLVRELLPEFPTLWVNTVGTRTPTLSAADLRRGASLLKRWVGRAGAARDEALPEGLQVVAPRMYPGFRRGWQRRLNARRIGAAVRRALDRSQPRGHGGGDPRALRRVVVTTLPITADLVGTLGADRWVYYCVDDYAQWPGTDHAVMDAMERELVAKVDAVVCVSETLRERVASMGRGDSTLVTHGVDVKLWDGTERTRWNSSLKTTDPVDDPWWWYERPEWANSWPERNVAVFWGLIDERLDVTWIRQTSAHAGLDLVAVVGPTASLHPLRSMPTNCTLYGQVDLRRLPELAQAASVLIMPYINAPVTRAMQPLKLKEYLATMKPVVVRDLPATRDWADCCDLASSAEQFAALVLERARTGTPQAQLEARRRRLPGESWSAKAAQLAAVIRG